MAEKEQNWRKVDNLEGVKKKRPAIWVFNAFTPGTKDLKELTWGKWKAVKSLSLPPPTPQPIFSCFSYNFAGF